MTTPEKGWPTNQKGYRDEAAILINNARRKLRDLLDGKPRDEKETILKIARIESELLDALRWLERAGACTTPGRELKNGRSLPDKPSATLL